MNIFVGNLPFTASESDLRSLFTDYGPIDSVRIITDRESGRSRGFAFVELSSDARPADAIRALDGYELEGRHLKVNEARPRTSS